MSFLIRYIFKQSGIEDTIKEAVEEIISDKDFLDLASIKPTPPSNSKEELKKLIKSLGLDIEIRDSRSSIDLTRRSTAISSNVTPLDIDNPIEVLWKIGEHFKGTKFGNS